MQHNSMNLLSPIESWRERERTGENADKARLAWPQEGYGVQLKDIWTYESLIPVQRENQKTLYTPTEYCK